MEIIQKIKKILKDDQGFSLIELMIVIVLMTTLLMVVGPTFSKYLTKARDNFALFTGTIVKVFDDSFLYGRTNFIIIHLYDPFEGDSETEMGDEIFKRNNAISVVNIKDGKYVEKKSKIFRHRQFDDDFRIEKVVLSSGEVVSNGPVTIPFYPKGYATNAIVHILVNDDEQYSIRIFKHLKEPEVIRDSYLTFEDL